MAFKIDENAGPFFSNGPASFQIIDAKEDIANNKHRSVYLKFEFEVTDKEGKKGKLKDCIFSNQAKKYKEFLKSINRQELEKETVPPLTFNGQTGVFSIGVNDKGYSCVEDYVPHDDKSVYHWIDTPAVTSAGKSKETAFDDDIPF
jgi:hypothetical protein